MRRKAVAAFLVIGVLISPRIIYANQIDLAANLIIERELVANVRLLSHWQMLGRGAAVSDELPSLFLERELIKYGFSPLDFDLENPERKSYFQEFQVNGHIHVDDLEHFGRSKEVLIKGRSRNVVGLLRGSTNEVVIIGAHYDHLGYQLGKKSAIYPGADDNASGVSATLEIAKALGRLAALGIQPRRTIIIAFWGAEEEGLVGSRWFVENLPREVSLKKIVAVLNLDMIGRNATDELSVIATPSGREIQSSCPELYRLHQDINLRHRLGFNFKSCRRDYDLFSCCFDSTSFYEINRPNGKIPSIVYFSGFHEDFHKSTDTFEKINYLKLTNVAKLVFYTAWEIAQMKELLRYRD